MPGFRKGFVFVLLLWAAAGVTVGAQATSGRIVGRVVDAATGSPLIGADVVVEGTSLVTATDRSGRFQLVGVPAGDVTVVIVYLGRADERASVTVTAGQPVTVEAKLAPVGYSETVQVRAEPIGEGQASALNRRSA